MQSKGEYIFVRSVVAGLLLAVCGFAQDTVADARKLALNGQRAEAEAMLSKRLADSPTDTDARTLYGTVLSWDSKYDEARKQLDQVLAEDRTNGDAMLALANVELWTDHPARAHELLTSVLRDRPIDTDALYADARTLVALKQKKEATDTLHHLLDVDPGNKDARKLLDSLGEEAQTWEATVEEYHEWFSDGIGNRAETQVSLKDATSIGSMIGRFSNAEEFGLVSNQIEMDYYPGFRKGTYAYLNAGFSPDHNLYPKYRVGADIYQRLGHGFEGTAGFRHLQFANDVNIFTTALSKYYGNWLFTGRGYFTPDLSGTSESFQVISRRYFHDSTTYFQLRFGRGSTPVEVVSLLDTEVLNSTTYDAALHCMLSRHWLADSEFGWSREDRLGRPLVNHLVGNLGLTFRF